MCLARAPTPFCTLNADGTVENHSCSRMQQILTLQVYGILDHSWGHGLGVSKPNAEVIGGLPGVRSLSLGSAHLHVSQARVL